MAGPASAGAADAAIPFNRSAIEGEEPNHIGQSVSIGQIAGDQSYSRKCQALLEEVLGAPKVLLTTSCTHALEMAALLLDIGPDDEVIVPSFTFVSTANAFVLRGARIRFADIRPDTLNLDENQIEPLISPRTRAMVPVHYAGVGCEMDAILAIARQYRISIVEDNAHGLFGKYKQRWLGTFGALATQSFHETKNITCGEGGALVLNDPDFVERAEILREKGTNRSRFFRGQVDKYSWVDIGSSYVMSDVLAAFLYGQLEVWRQIQEKRRRIWQRYDAELRDWAAGPRHRLPGRAGGLRTSLSHVLLDSSFLADSPSLDCFSQGPRHHGGLSLPAAAPVAHGPKTGRPAGRLPGERNYERSFVATAILQFP